MNFLNIKKYCWACYAVLFVFLAVVCAQPAMAQTIKSEVVTVEVHNQPVEKVLKEISQQTGVKFFYGEIVTNNKLTVNLSFNSKPLKDVLTEISKQTGLDFNRENNTIAVSVRKTNAAPSRQQAQPEKKISEIGYLIGLDSAAHFSRVFKKYTGLSPQEYREASAHL